MSIIIHNLNTFNQRQPNTIKEIMDYNMRLQSCKLIKHHQKLFQSYQILQLQIVYYQLRIISMSQHELPTDRSLELDQPLPSSPPQPFCSLQHPNDHFLQKMAAHLEFIEAEFMRNIDWQKRLLQQVRNDPYPSLKQSLQRKSSLYDPNRLGTDQQRQLRVILASVIGAEKQELSLKDMIKEANSKISKKNTPQVYTFSPIKNEDQEQPLEFPVVQRIITLNDLAPSTQRQLTVSPPSLPPRTPKHKPPKQPEKNHHKQLFPSPSYQTDQKYNKDITSLQQNQLRCQSQDRANTNSRQVTLQDSLGKRLFLQEPDKLIYIRDSPEEELIVGSDVSLTLSESNSDKNPLLCIPRMFYPQAHSPQSPVQSLKQLEQSLYLNVHEKQPTKRKAYRQYQRIQEVQGLCFGGHPKRRIGKCVVKKQNYFAYEQASASNVRKMHDSFGLAYQEYFSQGTSFGREECVYHCKIQQKQQKHIKNQ